MPEVQLLDVSKRFGRIEAIDDAHLEIRDREYVCILGPTGSGKTTLLRLIAGLLKPDEGEILLDGKNVNDVPPEDRDIAYMPQQYALFPHMTVLDNVSFGPVSRRRDPSEASQTALRLLRLVRLHERADAYPNELSGGMQQRVALARGLASGSKLLLLDEPLGALDARLRIDLRYQLKSMVKSLGLTAIHVTHDQEEAMVVADRIVVLRGGRFEQVGTPFHVYQHPDNLFVANFVGDTNFLEGTVLDVSSTGAIVELRGGLRLGVRETSYLVGERVVLTIRQESTSVDAFKHEGENTLPGTVVAVRFLGDFVRVDVRLENGDDVGAKMPLASVQTYANVGEKVGVKMKSTDVSIYSTPARGLTKEIEVT